MKGKDLFNGNQKRRALALCAVAAVLAPVLVLRLFWMQVIHYDRYRQALDDRLTRTVTVPGRRGRILDREGHVLADTRTVRSIALVDTTDPYDPDGNRLLNEEIGLLIDTAEDAGASVNDSFSIRADASGYSYTVSGWELTRFLADIYGYADPDDMTPQEKSKSAADAVADLCARYEIETGGEEEMPPRRVLQLISFRWQLSLHAYQKYIPTIIAPDVDQETAAEVLALARDYPGISVETSYARTYTDPEYFSGIIGYMGEATEEEAQALTDKGVSCRTGDLIGKAGLEASMETELRGVSGSETIIVDSLGRELELLDTRRPEDGADIRLTIDRDLQRAAYDLTEQYLADILLDKMIDRTAVMVTDENTTDSQIRIPSGDVYAAILLNIVDMSHFSASGASDEEKALLQARVDYGTKVRDAMTAELREYHTAYENLSVEYRYYQYRMIQLLYDSNILVRDRIDTSDSVYTAWTEEETACMSDFLDRAIEQGWIDPEALGLPRDTRDSGVLREALETFLLDAVDSDMDLIAAEYRFMIANGVITGDQILRVMIIQDAVPMAEEDKEAYMQGYIYSYNFLRSRIAQLDITPAQLELDPCTASVVVTDVYSGAVLAMVSYPGYDNNRIHEGSYYRSLMTRHSPLVNTAVQTLTAPGSTFKMVSAAAGAGEGVIDKDEWIHCGGIFRKIDPSPKCWIWPGGHGSMNMESAIANSCNTYFYELGYRLGEGDQHTDGKPDDALGTEKLARYIRYFGLDRPSGVEVEEADPIPASSDVVRACIGQSDNRYTTAGLARYAAAVATRGRVCKLTLIRSIEERSGQSTANTPVILENDSGVEVSDETWEVIHNGMRRVVRGEYYFNSLQDKGVCGKTGTAEHAPGEPSHVLFVGFAPAENPDISIAVRIPNGYSSTYAAQLGAQVMRYYFGTESLEQLLGEGTPGYTYSGD